MAVGLLRGAGEAAGQYVAGRRRIGWEGIGGEVKEGKRRGCGWAARCRENEGRRGGNRGRGEGREEAVQNEWPLVDGVQPKSPKQTSTQFPNPQGPFHKMQNDDVDTLRGYEFLTLLEIEYIPLPPSPLYRGFRFLLILLRHGLLFFSILLRGLDAHGSDY